LSYLVDTNVISELRQKKPNRGVVEWLASRPRDTLYLSTLTLGELRKGVERLAESPRKYALRDWLETELPDYFRGRLLAVDTQVADRWGYLLAKASRPVPAIDSLLAATASAHNLSFVSRNTKDVEGLGVELINPWNF
jgi:toxin FitB